MDLHGKTILTTRAAAQSSELRERIQALGGQVIECPTIEIAPPESWALVDHAIANLNSYHWILFTSSNAVDHFMKRVDSAGSKCDVAIAAVGSSTAARLQHWKLRVSLLPEQFRAEGLLEAFPSDLTGVRILFPRAETAREILPDELRKRGATVDIVTVYRTVKATTSGGLRKLMAEHRVDCVVFTSESTIRYLAESVNGDLSCIHNVPIAVIGPITRQAVDSYGLRVSIEPSRATIPDLVEAIRAALR